MGWRSRKTEADTTATPASSSGWTPEQRASQQRLNNRLADARRAPREGREPKGSEVRTDRRWV